MIKWGRGFVRRGIAAVLAGAMAAAAPAQACTNILVLAADGTPVYGRTLEYALETQSDVVVVPRNHEFIGTRPAKMAAPKWSSRYGFVGVMSFGQPFVSDGMNEKGLAGGALYFPGFAGYTPVDKADPSTALAPWEFLTWILSNFATVAEVKAALDKAVIVDLPAPMVNFTLPFHFPIHDATGASIVIEPIDGKFKVYDNPLGVLTNSPTFDWHLTNVRNYVRISPVGAAPLKIGSKSFEPFGQGSGLLGIPGDPTPPSRFIRALGYAASAKQVADGPQTVRLVEHIMNNFDIPIGFIDSAAKGGELEYTQWTSIADLRAKKYYIKGYRDQVLRTVDLTSFDLDAKGLQVAPFKLNLTPPPLQFNKS
ncbi:choloylglycine hydrolase family protein [Bradyrhizobium sp. 191]|uniref:linear amide C-N hydrolase n=1 Tax=Bradyrhizobium sp. 191 TaxID=2782659 RepID=UPI001FFE640D|nr:choloylglycine hydrolase family protein [Bradyrhizobium sp. 191]UPJ65026.1 choloylglycine hydrolase family protein [Bradyrhizobium sp. 191]